MRVLVTGGSGYLGSAIVRALASPRALANRLLRGIRTAVDPAAWPRDLRSRRRRRRGRAAGRRCLPRRSARQHLAAPQCRLRRRERRRYAARARRVPRSTGSRGWSTRRRSWPCRRRGAERRSQPTTTSEPRCARSQLVREAAQRGAARGDDGAGRGVRAGPGDRGQSRFAAPERPPPSPSARNRWSRSPLVLFLD